MARQPIVLTSNLIPNLEPNTGALANIYSNQDPVNRDPIVENEDGTFTIPTYERTVVDDILMTLIGRCTAELGQRYATFTE